MTSDLMSYFSLSGQQLGHLAACYFYAYLLMQLPSGVLLDRINIRLLLPAAIMICAMGAFVFAKAEYWWVAGFGRILVGLGGAFSAVGAMKLISMWFPGERFALMSGLMMTVGMLGAVGGQVPLAHFVTLVGWQSALLWCCGIGAVLAVTIALAMREPSDTPTTEVRQTWSALWTGVKAIIANPQSWLVSIYAGFAFAPISAFAGLWGVPFLSLKLDLPQATAAGYVSLVFVGFALGCPLSGWWSDRIGKRKPLMQIGTVLGLLCLMMVIYMPVHSELLYEILLFGFGFFTSFFFISFALIRELNPLWLSGTAIGFINSFDFGAVSEPAIGGILDKLWDHQLVDGVRQFTLENYHVALLLLPLSMLVAIVLLLWVKETHCEVAQ